MSTRYIAQILTNEDGPVILVRAETTAEALSLAADEASANDLVVTDEETDIRIGWVRATPCNPDGHEDFGGMGYCDGGRGTTHYRFGKPGRGAFRGAFVNATYAAPASCRCPDCGRESCTGEDCYWPDEAGITRPRRATAAPAAGGEQSRA
jgi:hypothetical protein